MNREPFDFEKYKAGRKAVTRDGRVPEQLTEFKIKNGIEYVGVLDGHIESWIEGGKYVDDVDTKNDLFLLPEVREVWVAVDENNRVVAYVSSEEKVEKALLSFPGHKKAKLIIYG